MTSQITHTLPKDLYDILKPWSNLNLNGDAREDIILLPSIDGRELVPFRIIGDVRGRVGLSEMLDQPRGVLTATSAEKLAQGFLRHGGYYKLQSQFVDPYVP